MDQIEEDDMAGLSTIVCVLVDGAIKCSQEATNLLPGPPSERGVSAALMLSCKSG